MLRSKHACRAGAIVEALCKLCLEHSLCQFNYYTLSKFKDEVRIQHSLCQYRCTYYMGLQTAVWLFKMRLRVLGLSIRVLDICSEDSMLRSHRNERTAKPNLCHLMYLFQRPGQYDPITSCRTHAQGP